MYQPSVSRLCKDFVEQAVKTWKYIELSELTNIGLSEESITDINLLDLQRTHPSEILTQKFSKPRESQIGADWEWWLGSQGKWLGLRIQAKKLDPDNLSYPFLEHVSTNGRQIELLINHSLIQQPPRIPIYIFYNYWDMQQFSAPWLCQTFPPQLEALGCGVVEAQLVKRILDAGSNQLADIANLMYPWSCLVCCHGYSKASGDSEKLPSRAFNFLSNAFERFPNEEYEPRYKREKFVTESAPDYVERMIQKEKLSEEDWAKIGVNRVTVIRALGNKTQIH